MPTCPSPEPWSAIAYRMVEDVGVRPGELVLIRDRVGDRAILDEVLLAVEESGGTPLPETTPPTYLTRLLTETDPARLRNWDLRRRDWVRSADRIIKLVCRAGDLSSVPASSLAAWREATQRLSHIEDERRIPSVMVALPEEETAAELALSQQELMAILKPALILTPAELRAELETSVRMTANTSSLTILTGEDCVLHLSRNGRQWLMDDGLIDDADRMGGGHVANLPAGALYTTVVENAGEGDLWLDQAGPASGVHLHFAAGWVTSIEAREGAAELEALFDNATGESRRISHVGIGFNPCLRQPIGWVLVDEHVHGALIVAFGENRYLGGRNASSLNIDFYSVTATIRADGQTIVDRGAIVGA